MLIIYNVFTFLRNEAELLTTSDWNEDSISIPNFLTQFWDSFAGFPRKVFFFSSENSSESDYSGETISRKSRQIEDMNIISLFISVSDLLIIM